MKKGGRRLVKKEKNKYRKVKKGKEMRKRKIIVKSWTKCENKKKNKREDERKQQRKEGEKSTKRKGTVQARNEKETEKVKKLH